MELIIITGPMAVGKMAVGMEISKKTGLGLFHNHMTIEPVIKLFPYGTKEANYLINHFRSEIFKTMVNSEMPGMIFTFVWAFDLQEDHDYINNLIKQFEEKDATVYIVELEADLETRLERNKTPLRLQEKASKRDVPATEERMKKIGDKYRLTSNEGEVKHKNYFRLKNDDLTPEEAADRIISHFGLTKV